MIRAPLLAVAGPLLLALAATALAEPAVTVKAVELRQNPAADAKSVASLASDTPVETLRREGAWVQLRAGKTTGWAKLFDIRMAGGDSAPNRKGGAGIAETLNLAAGNRGTTATTGVRGLDEDMLRKAAPNAQEVATLASFAASKGDAQAFAQAGRLEPRRVNSLADAPPAPAAGKAK
jgi:hypothetical protein